jgi:predicted transposase/invertase (TIGR01784 family)
MDTRKAKDKKRPITWHTAFYDAIRLEFYQYWKVLNFEFEYPLNTEPLRIDLNRKRLENIFEASKKMPKRAPLSAYLSVIVEANPERISEESEMPRFSVAGAARILREAGWADEWVKKAEEQGEKIGEKRGEKKGEKTGREQTQLEIAKNLAKMGLKIDEVAKATKLSVPKLRPLFSKKS